MIGFLRGEVFENTEGKLLVVVSGTPGGAGVGYSVAVPQNAEYGLIPSGKALSLYVHTHVREDALDLYGFTSRDERDLFLILLGANGIGPKMALGILSRVQPAQLIQAVMNDDKDALTAIPGIGKKTAERLILDLGDKIRKKIQAGELSAGSAAKATGSRASAPAKSTVFNDAKLALVGLGYREPEVASLLERVIAEFDAPPKQTEELVRAALRQLL